jgi:xanthine dehydrogenase YagT iron-sulfur-binding subunit
MTLPPCYTPPDDDDQPDDPSRRSFVLGSAAAAAAIVVSPILGSSAEGAETAPKVDQNAIPVALTVNGTRHELRLDPRTTLLDALREHLDLTGTKKGCDQGACGACTVLIDGRRYNSCLTLAVMHSDQKITTNDGFQCGYCTPGQICSAVALLKEGHAGSDDEIREWMSGNICRCGAYGGIVEAVKEAAKNGGANAPV